jgi:hypothetical protein
MKKILFLLAFVLTIVSCSVGDDTDRNFTLLPVNDVDIPNKFKVDSISTFNIRYKRETDCQIFNGIYFNPTETHVDIAIKVVELQESNCQPDNESIYEVPLYFKPSQSGTYMLKFWNGKDPNGQDQFINTEVIVP